MGEQRIASLSDLPAGALRLVKAGDKRLAVVRTGDGVFALDNACPHQGYALVQGELKDGTVTCHWHNWKFRVRDGACVLGEESVRSYPVRIEGDDVIADLTDPSNDEIRPRLLASLRRGIARHEVGRMSRDVVRLLRAAANPAELVWEAVAYGAPRAEYGWGHALATATDCLALVDRYEGDARALPIMQGIAAITEVELRRPVRPQPAPATSLPHDPRSAFRAAVEAEDVDRAEAMVLAAIEAGYDGDELARWFVESVSDHHLGYGHMAIYTQKAFELVGRLGWDRAATVLPHLVPALVYGTREDKLPYMRPFMKALATLDLEKLAKVDADPAWRDDDRRLRDALLGHEKLAPVRAVERALLDGAGVDGVLDAVVAAAAERMLRYDVRLDFDPHVEFGWLDITHAITYANAVRWAWHRHPGPDTVRLALFSAFQANYSGRAEWKVATASGTAPRTPRVEPRDDGNLQTAVEAQDEAGSVALAAGLPLATATDQLERAALSDRASSFIVAAHFVKTSRAAGEEAARTGDPLPVAAVARFMSAPRLERFVARNVYEAVDFVSGRRTDRENEI
ncbi:MAG TPA: Rieske (2Fe-2S) protein [Acidimicrobiales bacterium]